MDKIKEKLSLLTTEPGCYLMKNVDGKIIYVGKAKNLKRRVSSYFNREHTGKTKALVENIHDFEYIVTKTEVESLLLEINLIKKYSPKYNIMLKDNKSYPYIEITNETYPRLIISRPRKIKGHKGKLFGPYPNANAARKTVELLNRIYPFRKCHTMDKKVCLYYHIGQCLGYCEKKINKSIIKKMTDEVSSFLKGNYDEVRKKIKNLMSEASSKLNFEMALEYKEMLEYIDKVLEKQKISLNDNVDRDVINYYVKNDYIYRTTDNFSFGGNHDTNITLYDVVDRDWWKKIYQDLNTRIPNALAEDVNSNTEETGYYGCWSNEYDDVSQAQTMYLEFESEDTMGRARIILEGRVEGSGTYHIYEDGTFSCNMVLDKDYSNEDEQAEQMNISVYLEGQMVDNNNIECTLQYVGRDEIYSYYLSRITE